MDSSFPLADARENRRENRGELTSGNNHVFPGNRFDQHWNRADSCVAISIIILSLLCFLPGLGSFGILDPSDGYYSEGAREMVESGDYLTPHLNYKPWFDKPILNYWLIALSYKAFGINEFSARLPSALCASFLSMLSYVFARRFVRRRAAWLSSLILLSSPLWLIVGHLSLTDMPFTFFVWLALGSFFLCIERRVNRVVWLGYLSLGLAVLCKGPLAIILVFMNLGAYVLITSCGRGNSFLAKFGLGMAQGAQARIGGSGRSGSQEFPRVVISPGSSGKETWTETLGRLQIFKGSILMLAVAVPWYALETITTGGAFFKEFFLNQNLNRALGSIDHRASVLYYIPIILGGFFPWIIMLIFMLPAIYGLLRRFLRRPSSRSPYQSLLIFSSTTSLATLLFFSAMPTKLATYILPAIPTLALVVGMSADKYLMLQKTSTIRWAAPVIACTALAILLAPFAIPQIINLPLSLVISATIYSVILLGYAVVLWKGSFKQALNLVVILFVFGGGVMVPLGLKAAYDLKDKDFHLLLRKVKIMGGSPLLVGRRNPSAIFYLQHELKYFPESNALAKYLQQSPGRHLLLVDNYCMNIVSQHVNRITTLDRRGKWYLALAEQAAGNR